MLLGRVLPYQVRAPDNGGWYEMDAIIFFCVLPIILLFVGSIGVSVFQIGVNKSIEDFENDLKD